MNASSSYTSAQSILESFQPCELDGFSSRVNLGSSRLSVSATVVERTSRIEKNPAHVGTIVGTIGLFVGVVASVLYAARQEEN